MDISAALYTVGSLGFLLVDVMEFFTFTSVFLLRLNIACSMTGVSASLCPCFCLWLWLPDSLSVDLNVGILVCF